MLIEMIATDFKHLKKFNNNQYPEVQDFLKYFTQLCGDLVTQSNKTYFEILSPDLGHEDEVEEAGVIDIVSLPQLHFLLREVERFEIYLLQQQEQQQRQMRNANKPTDDEKNAAAAARPK
jgi:hypothetical protein